MKKSYILFIIIIAALVLIKIFVFPSPAENAQGADKQGKGAPAPVSVSVLHPELLNNTLFVTGSVLPSEEVNLSAETQGKVVRILFTEGSEVSKGQLLVKLNDAELQAQLKKLKANEQLLNEKEVRQKKLLQINGISQEEYDATLTQLNGTKADIEMLNAQIAKTEIYAPFSGSIGLSNLSVGSFVLPNTPIALLQQRNPVKIDFSIPEKYASSIKRGDSIHFIPGNADTRYTAKISAIQPKADPGTHTVQIRALCPNPDGKIFPGVFARVSFAPAKAEQSILIPSEALIPTLKGQKVFVVKNGLAEEIMVKSGLRSSSKVQITEGLNDGDSLVVSGLMSLKKASPVKVIGGKNKK